MEGNQAAAAQPRSDAAEYRVYRQRQRSAAGALLSGAPPAGRRAGSQHSDPPLPIRISIWTTTTSTWPSSSTISTIKISYPVWCSKKNSIWWQSRHPAVGKALVHTDELDPAKELFLKWDDPYQLWHDQWLTNYARPHFSTDIITLIGELWDDDQYWLVAPESVVAALSRRRPVYVSRLKNPPPDRCCYKITHRRPCLPARKRWPILRRSWTNTWPPSGSTFRWDRSGGRNREITAGRAVPPPPFSAAPWPPRCAHSCRHRRGGCSPSPLGPKAEPGTVAMWAWSSR